MLLPILSLFWLVFFCGRKYCSWNLWAKKNEDKRLQVAPFSCGARRSMQPTFSIVFFNFSLDNNVPLRQWICYLWAGPLLHAQHSFCLKHFECGTFFLSSSLFCSLSLSFTLSLHRSSRKHFSNALHAHRFIVWSTYTHCFGPAKLMKFASKYNAVNTRLLND